MSDMAESFERGDLHRHGAVGTWRLTLTFPATGRSLKAVIAFTGDGIVHQTVGTPESALGVWEPHGQNEFRVTFFFARHGFRSDVSGQVIPTGLQSISRVRADFTLIDGDAVTASATAETFDPTETTIFSTEQATATGARMTVIAQ